MQYWLKQFFVWGGGSIVLLLLILIILAQKEKPETITYGMSFNVPYAIELGLDPMVVLSSFIDELKIRHFRIAAGQTRTPLKDSGR